MLLTASDIFDLASCPTGAVAWTRAYVLRVLASHAVEASEMSEADFPAPLPSTGHYPAADVLAWLGY